MSEPMLDFRLFRYALASANSGSFHRAAAALHVQQSTVSRGVRSLEDRLGADLFERDHAGIRPTPVGDYFLREAAEGFDHLQRATERIRAIQRGEIGELKVGISVPLSVLGDLLEHVREASPGTSIDVIEGSTTATCSAVEKRHVDIAFVPKIAGSETLRSFHLQDEQLIVVLAAANIRSPPVPMPIAELVTEPLILSAGDLGSDIAIYIRRRLGRLGLEPIIHFHQVSQANLFSMVARGFGRTIIIGPLAAAASDQVVLVPLAGRSIMPISAAWLESNLNPALDRLLDVVQKSKREGSYVGREEG